MSASLAVDETAKANSVTSHFAILLFLALALMSALLNSSAPTPLYPLYQHQLGLTSVSLTMIYGAYAAGVLISLFGVGNMAGKVKDLRSMIVPALLIVLAGALLFSLADSFWMMFMARLLAGVGTGALTGAANIALVRFGPKDGGKNAALIATLSFTMGLALGPIFSGVALQTGFHTTSLPFIIIMVVAAVAVLGVMLKWPRDVVIAPLNGQSVAAAEVENSGLAEGLRATGSKFFLCAGALFICWAVAASILAIGPSVAEKLLGMHSRGMYGYVIAVYLLIAGISQILSRRINARHSLMFGCLAQALSVVVFAEAIHIHSLALAGAGMVIAGYAYGAIFVGSATLVNLISPKSSHARLISLFYVIAYIANWVPILLGVVIDQVSLLLAVNLLFMVSTVVCLALSVLVTRAGFPR
ncbi:MFS transporter [Serratia odorifera]|uniref:Transporter, major facilitator family protein n=2 Tax=Serratia odorifera TaxID=618 RepID=D4E3R0_SEROD|nr:MFS transporter [Serratia odorifera]EFE95608.1 transporter, major facilitator family protein [Serratia odorifera DSM 4582]PNK90234.1 MFS transporter [Serratia odorifera]RII71326.1 MFS transporter [Serratia odorifera]VDZ60395.1 multidrug resistance protein [Serratia odorifera]HEJ9094517.1 MFS transporter [Serratia odorifera]